MEAIREDLPAQVHELARAIAELKERMSALERAMGGREGAVALPPPRAGDRRERCGRQYLFRRRRRGQR